MCFSWTFLLFLSFFLYNVSDMKWKKSFVPNCSMRNCLLIWVDWLRFPNIWTVLNLKTFNCKMSEFGSWIMKFCNKDGLCQVKHIFHQLFFPYWMCLIDYNHICLSIFLFNLITQSNFQKNQITHVSFWQRSGEKFP